MQLALLPKLHGVAEHPNKAPLSTSMIVGTRLVGNLQWENYWTKLHSFLASRLSLGTKGSTFYQSLAQAREVTRLHPS